VPPHFPTASPPQRRKFPKLVLPSRRHGSSTSPRAGSVPPPSETSPSRCADRHPHEEKGEDAIAVAVETARAHESDEELARMLQVSHLPFPIYRRQPWRRPSSLQVRHLPYPICRLASARRKGRMWQRQRWPSRRPGHRGSLARSSRGCFTRR
jgi:hypothetical protein